MLIPYSCFKFKDVQDQINCLEFSEKHDKVLIGLSSG